MIDKEASVRYDGVMDTLLVGLARTPETIHPVRTPEQRRAVLELAARDDFAFACSNPFTPDVVDYTGPFTLLWYDTGEQLHVTRIGKRGAVLRDVTA